MFNVIISKSEASGKANIHNINKKIQVMYLKIKVMDIGHFQEHVNYLTTALAAHGMIMPYLMHHLFKVNKVFGNRELREYHT